MTDGRVLLQSSQVTILKQDKVAALMDNDAHLALEEGCCYSIDAKPHGHGDVHALMYTSGTAEAWSEAGVKWVYFFQDTNALSITSLAAVVGVSVDLDLEVRRRGCELNRPVARAELFILHVYNFVFICFL